MIKKIQQYSKQYPEVWIQIIFLLISIIYASPYFFSNSLNDHDMFFNYLRVREVGEDLIHLHIPSFTIYTNEILGGATSYFYPYLLLIPIALLSVFIKGTQVLEIIMFVGMYGGLNITRQVWKVINKNDDFDCLFAVIYCASSMAFSVGYARGDFGAFYSAMLAPIAFIGYYEWLKHGKWKMMAIGVSLLIYSNEASFICLLLGLVILTIFNITKLNIKRIINLIKSVITTLILTMAYWIPTLIIYLQNKIFIPSQAVEPSFSSKPIIFSSLRTYFIPQLCSMWGVLDLLGITVVIIEWGQLSRIEHQLGILGLLIYIINFRPIAIWLLSNTPLMKMQFLYRFVFISHFIFTLFLVQYLIYKMPNKISFTKCKWLFGVLFTWILIVLSVGACMQVMVNGFSRNNIYHPHSYRTLNHTVQKESKIYSIHNSMITYPQILHGLPINYGDYYPRSIVTINNNHNEQYSHFNVLPRFDEYTTTNELKYHSDDSQYHKILMVTMKGQKYYFKNNNRLTKVRIHHHLVYIKMHKGLNRIRIQVPTMWYQYASIIGSICGVGYLILKRKKNNND